jgi:hypothetical protein
MGFSLLLIVSLLTGCVEKYETEEVTAVVVSKEHDERQVSYKTVKKTVDGKTKSEKKKVVEPEEWEVTLKYKGIETEFEFSNDDLFDTVEIGDEVKVNYVIGLDKEGKVVSTKIDLIDEK